jgi:hypothetical protein
MDLSIEQAEMFPYLASVTKPKSFIRQWIDSTMVHGPLLTPAQAAAHLVVTRARVNQLLNEDRIAAVDVAGKRYVAVSALENFQTEPLNRGGRPKLLERFKVAFGDRRAEKTS